MTIVWDAAGLATLGWWLIGLSAVCWLRVWFKPNADAWPYWASAGCVLLVCALCAAAGWGLVRSSGGVVDLSLACEPYRYVGHPLKRTGKRASLTFDA